MTTSVFQIDGMTCEGCASIVETAIRGVPGMLAVAVDYEKRQPMVGSDIGCPVTKVQIVLALQQADSQIPQWS